MGIDTSSFDEGRPKTEIVVEKVAVGIVACHSLAEHWRDCACPLSLLHHIGPEEIADEGRCRIPCFVDRSVEGWDASLRSESYLIDVNSLMVNK